MSSIQNCALTGGTIERSRTAAVFTVRSRIAELVHPSFTDLNLALWRQVVFARPTHEIRFESCYDIAYVFKAQEFGCPKNLPSVELKSLFFSFLVQQGDAVPDEAEIIFGGSKSFTNSCESSPSPSICSSKWSLSALSSDDASDLSDGTIKGSDGEVEDSSFIQLEEERKVKAVIKGIPIEIETDEVKAELEYQGYPVLTVHRMHRKDGSALGMTLAILENTNMAKDIF
ncbi:hypothetical protein EVAR_93641_1 [Eumeta japonica]|uniref:Uncharacterized protein n=1 Tax=Eumeta variegata TaxID=151549 RepID=A0A4C1TQS8_EUMVA|nr:hypothetical protein EVAR_93641_1 [Eumeta japonica]